METMLFCPWEPSTYLIFSSNAYPLFYYSHFAPILVGAFLVTMLLWQNPRSLAIRMLSILFALSTVWILADMVMTATNRPDMVVFLWSAVVLIEPLVYVAGLFLVYAFAYNKLPSFDELVLCTILLVPLIALAPTAFNIPGLYLEDCNADEGFIASHYSYGIEIVFTLWLLFVAIGAIVKSRDALEKRKLSFFLSGLLLFLVSFASGNLIGTITGDWVSAQYGLFGLPVFIGFLGYIIVRFNAFNVRVLEAQVLVAALALLVLSLLFVESLKWVFIIAGGTFLLVCILGWILIRGVKREIELRHTVEKQASDLEQANRQQESLLHFISHEVKGYLTKSQAGFASIVEGDFGAVPDLLKRMATSALADTRKGVSTVMEILSASNLQKGTVSYEKKRFDFKACVERAVQDFKPTVEQKKLSLDVSLGEGDFSYEGDEHKISQHVIRNLIDNAVKYTPQGSISVTLSRKKDAIRFSVKDTGVGLTDDDKKNLFTEGGKGKESLKVNVDSTGYGLYIAKEITEAHGGKIWAESGGRGRGSEFIVELPVG